MINLDIKDIVQINVTFIAGGLIFLTLIEGVLDMKDSAIGLVTGILIITMMIFSLSCWIALRGEKDAATKLMQLGFILLFIFLLGIFIAKAIIGVIEVTKKVSQITTNKSNSEQGSLNQNLTNHTTINLTNIPHVLDAIRLSLKGYQIE